MPALSQPESEKTLASSPERLNVIFHEFSMEPVGLGMTRHANTEWNSYAQTSFME